MILGWVQVETYNRDSGVVKSQVIIVCFGISMRSSRKYADPFQLLQLQYLSIDYYTDMQGILEMAYSFMHCQLCENWLALAFPGCERDNLLMASVSPNG